MRDKELREKLAKRLCYLWVLRDREPNIYKACNLVYEKEDIYCMYGSDDEVMDKAHSYYSGENYNQIAEQGKRYKYDIKTNTIVG